MLCANQAHHRRYRPPRWPARSAWWPLWRAAPGSPRRSIRKAEQLRHSRVHRAAVRAYLKRQQHSNAVSIIEFIVLTARIRHKYLALCSLPRSCSVRVGGMKAAETCHGTLLSAEHHLAVCYRYERKLRATRSVQTVCDMSANYAQHGQCANVMQTLRKQCPNYAQTSWNSVQTQRKQCPNVAVTCTQHVHAMNFPTAERRGVASRS